MIEETNAIAAAIKKYLSPRTPAKRKPLSTGPTADKIASGNT